MKRPQSVITCSGYVVLVSLVLPGLAAAEVGTAKGTVRPIAWAPEVEVCTVVESEPSDHCVVPSADGSFEISGVKIPNLPPLPRMCGEGLSVEGAELVFIPTFRSGLLTQYWDHKLYVGEAGFVEFCHGSVAEDVDADLVEGGRISGTVVAEEGGSALAGVEACAVSVSSPTGTKSCDDTSMAGRYELIGLMPGLYMVGFRGQGRSAVYAPWYYDNAASSIGATAVSISLGATKIIDPRLAEGSRIEGTVTSSIGGLPLAMRSVCLFAPTAVTADRCTDTGARGTFDFEGVPAGPWQVGFGLGAAEIVGAGSTAEVEGFVPQYYQGAVVRSEARVLTVAGAQELVGVDAALTAPPLLPAATTSALPSAWSPTAPIVAPPSPPKRKACRRGYAKQRRDGVIRCVKKKRAARGRHGHS